MTIVAGFPGKGLLDNGTPQVEGRFVVLAADSEASGPVLKSSVQKVSRIDKDGCTCLLAGAGGGDFIRFAVQEISEALLPPFSQEGVRATIERIVTDIHTSTTVS